MAEIKDYITYPDDRGSINISEEVVAVVAGSAALEVDGVAGLYTTPGRDIAEIMGKKGLSKGVRIQAEDKNITADIFILAEMGVAIGKIGEAVQDAVTSAIEASTGLSVAAVNVHICGVTFKKK